MLGQVTRVQYCKNRRNRNYGFIKGDDNNDYWFSLSGMVGYEVGDIVSFMGGENEKGYIASNVSLLP